jgi:hypothetical protein
MRQVIHCTIGCLIALGIALVGVIFTDLNPLIIGLCSALLAIVYIEVMEHRLHRRLWYRLGFKPHLFSCENGEHWWRAVWGDERNHVKGRYICENCPKTCDELPPDALVVESESERMIREYRRHMP